MIVLTMLVTAIAPVVLWATARPPISSAANQLGLLLARTAPAGQIVNSSTQAFGGPTYWLFPALGWFSQNEAVCVLIQTFFQIIVCVGMVEFWILQASPVRSAEFCERRASLYVRTIALGLVWALAVGILVSQVRVVLVSWHNETIGNTWQIYDGTMDVESTAAKVTAASSLLLYVLGVLFIARRLVQRMQILLLAERPAGSCRVCGYAASGLAICPECGGKIDASLKRSPKETLLNARLLGRWWRAAIALAVGASIVAGILAPLTLGVAWIVRQRWSA